MNASDWSFVSTRDPAPAQTPVVVTPLLLPDPEPLEVVVVPPLLVVVVPPLLVVSVPPDEVVVMVPPSGVDWVVPEEHAVVTHAVAHTLPATNERRRAVPVSLEVKFRILPTPVDLGPTSTERVLALMKYALGGPESKEIVVKTRCLPLRFAS
jgi:hypothetical protein